MTHSWPRHGANLWNVVNIRSEICYDLRKLRLPERHLVCRIQREKIWNWSVSHLILFSNLLSFNINDWRRLANCLLQRISWFRWRRWGRSLETSTYIGGWVWLFVKTTSDWLFIISLAHSLTTKTPTLIGLSVNADCQNKLKLNNTVFSIPLDSDISGE